jgi:hypothetical protein
MANRHHRSVYIPAPLDKALLEHPEINVSQVCKVALEVATGLIQTQEATPPGELTSTMSGKLSDIEAQLRTSVSTLEKIARLAAVQAGMVVLTQEEAAAYRGILEVGIKQFILRTKQEAIEEYKQEQIRTRKKKSKAKNLVDPAPSPAPGSLSPATVNQQQEKEDAPEQRDGLKITCTDCGDQADVRCQLCDTPLCWTCWTGPDIDAPALELCQLCRSVAQP